MLNEFQMLNNTNICKKDSRMSVYQTIRESYVCYNDLKPQLTEAVISNVILLMIKQASATYRQALEILTVADNNLVKLAKTRTSGNEVTTNNVLLHTLQVIALAIDSSIIQYLCSFLE